MKKFLALVLAVTMVIAIVPTTFAAPAKQFEKSTTQKDVDSPISQKVVDSNGNVVEAAEKRSDKTITTENVNKKYQSINSSSFDTKADKWKAIPRTGVELMDQQDSLIGGYWFSNEETNVFGIVDDWYTDSRETYVQVMNVMEENSEGDSKAYKRFNKGETVWFNYDIAKTFDTGSQTIVPLDKEVAVSCYLFAGTYDSFTGTEEGDGIKMVNAWMSGQSGVSCKVITPEDDYVYMFVFVIDDTTLSQFGAWISISSADEKNEFKNIKDGGSMTVGKAVSTDIGGAGTSLTLAPYGSTYYMTNGAKYSVTLEGGKNYVAMFDSPDSIGTRIYFCDENMDIINETFVGSGAIAAGGNYKDSALIVMPPVSGTYYIVVCGFYMGDEGTMETTVFNWNDVAAPLETSSTVIDLDALGTENHEEASSTGTKFWGYYWYPDYSLGELIIKYPGTYTVKGNNANVFCDIYDGVNIVLDNATIGSLWKGGSGYAPSTITAKGEATIENTSLQYSVYNYEGVNSGLYFMGDKLTVLSGGNSLGAVITDSTPVHILTKTFEVYSTEQQGYYPIALWTTGKNHPELTLGKGATFTDGNQKATMYYDGDGYFFFGYTVAKAAELYRLHNEPTLHEASIEFVLTTEGDAPTPPGPTPTGVLGDANCDGKVNTGDATMVLKHAASILVLEGDGLANADINQDGKVNTGDATMILKVVAGIIAQP